MTKPITKSLPILASSRSCGDCQGCCVWLTVPAGADTVGVAHERGCDCPKLEANGCSIYESRPKLCRDFRCLYLEGFGAEEDRPDRLGVIYHVAKDEKAQPFVAATELRAGALEPGTRGRDQANEMGFQVTVMMAFVDGRRQAVMPMNLAQCMGLMDPAKAHEQGMVLAKP